MVSTTEQEFDFNWKIFVDGLLEGYHIRSTHAETFYPRQYDNLKVVECFGRNSRVSYPYRSIEKLRDNAPCRAQGRRRADPTLSSVSERFGGDVPDHMTMAVIEPLTVDRTRLVTYTLTYARRSGRGHEGQGFRYGGTAEDREMASAIQRGLATGANEAFTFGLFEGAIRHFHRNLAAAIEGP